MKAKKVIKAIFRGLLIFAELVVASISGAIFANSFGVKSDTQFILTAVFFATAFFFGIHAAIEKLKR